MNEGNRRKQDDNINVSRSEGKISIERKRKATADVEFEGNIVESLMVPVSTHKASVDMKNTESKNSFQPNFRENSLTSSVQEDINDTKSSRLSTISEGEAKQSYQKVYDEYEEDTSGFKWNPPSKKIRGPSGVFTTTPLRRVPLISGKKKMKKARKAVKMEQASTAVMEAEALRNQMINDLRKEIHLEEYNAEQEFVLEEKQAALRRKQLEDTWYIMHEIKRAFMDYVAVVEEEETWTRYMACDGLPDPGSISDMNTYLFLWTMEDGECSMDTLGQRTDTVIYLTSKLNEIIHHSLINSEDYLNDCKEIRERLRDKLQEWMDMACYRLLRQIERDMLREDLRNARYINVSTHFVCCIWAPITLPLSIKQVNEKERKPVELYFKEIELSIKLPSDVDCYSAAIRALWLKFDHFSDRASSYDSPEIPEEKGIVIDLLGHVEREYKAKLKIREEQANERKQRLEEKKAMLEKLENPPAAKPAVRPEKKGKQSKKQGASARSKKTELAGKSKSKAKSETEPESDSEQKSFPYLPTPSEVILLQEEEARKKMRKSLFVRCEKTEVNLRKYKILGGTFQIDLIHQPPQPKESARNILLTTLQLPKDLKRMPFARAYVPPTSGGDNRTPEVIEAEMKALEAAMEALVLVTLRLPEAVLWFEPPLVAHWIPEKKIWSTADIHDIKFNEEKQTIAFRTGKLGIHGLAAYKFVNLPFQSWELKPEIGRNSGGGVVLSIVAATVQAEFIVREDMVCLNSLAGGTSEILRDIIGRYMKLHFLIEKMREGGCDLFPERDAFSYIKGIFMKHPTAEKHLLECIGLLSTSYAFSWSRWNAARSPREIVLQYKELHGCSAKERTNVTLLVTPMRTMTVECTEVSAEFSDSPIDSDDLKFYADLYHLALQNAGIKTRMLMEKVSFKLALTVTKLLQSTNIISASS